jgi:hypothetical protein
MRIINTKIKEKMKKLREMKKSKKESDIHNEGDCLFKHYIKSVLVEMMLNMLVMLMVLVEILKQL